MKLLVFLFFVLAPLAGSANCTDGVDCFCDTVTGPGGSTIIMCEDFEDAAFYELVDGHWVDNDPGEERGEDCLWTSRYGLGSQSMWAQDQPNASPRIGDQCNVTGGSFCNCLKEWCSEAQGNVVDGLGADCWEANTDDKTALDIMRAGDANDEMPSLSDPRYPGGSGPIGGRQWMGNRQNPAGTAGLRGGTSLSNITDIGITVGYAFATNFVTSDIMLGPIKFTEFSPGLNSALVGFSSSPIGMQDHFPFQGFITPSSGCNAGLVSNLTVGTATGTLLGDFECDTRFRWHGEDGGGSFYYQPTDWPLGDWGCYRTRITNLDTSNTCVTQWFGDGSTETVVVDFCGLDGTQLVTSSGVSRMDFNFYSNYFNEVSGVETTYRHEDNWVITDGEPVSCNDIFENSISSEPSPNVRGVTITERLQ